MANLKRGRLSSWLAGLLEPVALALPGRRLLARSRHYRLISHFESVLLLRPDGSEVEIAELYGEPSTAVIDADERWCLVAGSGLVFYPLERGGSARSMLSAPGDTWWVEACYQHARDAVRFVVDPHGRHAGLYELDTVSLEVRPLVAGAAASPR